MSYHFLLDIALILISTKLLGLLTKRFHMPQVVGSLLAGLLLGPAVLNILNATEFIAITAELGVIVIMFTAGMGTNINELKNSGKSGTLVAVCGVLVPILIGTGVAWMFNRGSFADGGPILLQNIFIGVILTATSVSITVEALREMGKLTTRVGNTILAAAIIDDILGLIALTIVTAIGGADVNIWMVLLKIVLFFVFVGITGFFVHRLINWYAEHVKQRDLHRFPVMAFVVCLLFAYCAEEFFGVADIIGAFAAGLVISSSSKGKYIESKFEPLSYLLLSPIFFASIGIKIQIPSMSWMLILLTLCIILAAILSKLIGCGLGAKLTGYSMRESVQIGLGMVCRGEVALIVANRGMAMGLMPKSFFGPVILMVIFTAVLTPILLKISFRDKKEEITESDLSDRYIETEQMDYIAEEILEKSHEMQEKKDRS